MTGEERLRAGPYDDTERLRLEQEIKTTLAGAVAEAMEWGRDPLEQLEEQGNGSDAGDVHEIATRLWPDGRDRIGHLNRLSGEVEADLDGAWSAVVRVAEAYDRRTAGLDGDEVARLCRGIPSEPI